MKNKYIICKICNEYVCYHDSEVEVKGIEKYIQCPHCMNYININYEKE